MSPETGSIEWDGTAVVAQVADHYNLVINKGYQHGVQIGMRFLIYSVSETEIMDPETGVSLGNLEIVKGTGTVTHAQEKMSTIRSDRTRLMPKKTVVRRGNFVIGGQEEIQEHSTEVLPFSGANTGDKAKLV